jgi:hypothetical protein
MNKQKYQIIDNFLDPYEFDSVRNLMESNEFPWYFSDTVVKDVEENNINMYQFTHAFYKFSVPVSSYFDGLSPILNKLNYKALIRIKANLNPATKEIFEHGYHTDFKNTDSNQKTAVFYVNTNNGSTIFEDGTKIESVANRFIVFDTDLLHTGTTCTDQKRRIVINFNYFV